MSESTMRRLVPLIVFVTIGVTLGAGCSSDDAGGDRASETTTSAGESTDATATSTSVPDPAKFNSTLDRLATQIDEAEGDICELLGGLDRAGSAGSPTSPDQAVVAGQFIAKAYRAIADAAPAEVAAEADRVREAADAMAAETEAPDFDAEQFIADGPTAFADEDFIAAVSKVFASIEDECGTPTS